MYPSQKIILVSHHLSVSIYAQLAIALQSFGVSNILLVLLSSRDKALAQRLGLPSANILVFEESKAVPIYPLLSVNQILSKYPDIPWSTVIASERSFTDYSFTFGSIGTRPESYEYVLTLATHLISFFTHIFKTHAPSHVISVYGDNIFTSVVNHIANHCRTPLIIPHPSYLTLPGSSDSGYFSSSYLLEVQDMKSRYQELLNSELSPSQVSYAKQLVHQLSIYDGAKFVSKLYKHTGYGLNLSPNILSLYSYLLSNLKLDKSTHFYKISPIAKFHSNIKRFIRFFQFKSFLRHNSQSLPEQFFFFPLHFQPEASTLVNGIWYSNQIALIENLSKALPLGFKLVVKEHPRGRGTRPLWQYKHLSSFYNIVFSDLDSKHILNASSGVITINGTIGLEALAISRPVFMLTDTFHTFHDLYFRPSSFQQLSYMLNKIAISYRRPASFYKDIDVYRVLLAYTDSLFLFHPFRVDPTVLALSIYNKYFSH